MTPPQRAALWSNFEAAVLLMDRARRAPSETGPEIKIGAVLEESCVGFLDCPLMEEMGIGSFQIRWRFKVVGRGGSIKKLVQLLPETLLLLRTVDFL